MSYRNRPVLDRKHRPRWQDELRTQQLIVAGFALAIALAIGIFAAAAWSAYYDASLRQVALVGGTPISQAELSRRTDIIRAQLNATALDLNNRLGGANDQILQQQIQQINDAISRVDTLAFDSLLTGTVLAQRTDAYGLSVGEAALDAEVEGRRSTPERKKLSLIMVHPTLAQGAPAGSQPTDADWEAAHQKASGILAEIQGGADFATLATERSDDASKQSGGLLGWVGPADTQFGKYFELAADTPAGEIVGPLRNDEGWFVLRIEGRQAAGRDKVLDDLLAKANVTDVEYRAVVRSDLLRGAFRDYFAGTVVGRYQPQREVAQIVLANDKGVPVPQSLIRHLLVQPIPGATSQADATDAQWAAALAKAEQLRAEALKPNADWFELAKQSDDPGSRDRGGSLGWYDPASSGFVQGFKDAVAPLGIGEVSEPVRTEFGYHVIQLVDQRTSAAALAQRLVSKLREDPGSFASVASLMSEDTATAQKGGDLGWVIHYQFDAARDTAIFDLTTADQITEPVTSSGSIYIYKLLDSSDARLVPEAQRSQVGASGFSTWLQELKDRAGIWTDPQLAPATATA